MSSRSGKKAYLASKVDQITIKVTSMSATAIFGDLLELARFWKPAGTLAFHIPLIFGALLSKIIEPRWISGHSFLAVNGWLLLSSFFQRAAACAWNDATDYKFDKQVARTRNRPIPRGSISPNAARLWAVILTLWWIWCVYFAQSQSQLAMWTLIPNFVFNLAYPYMKRFTDWPQIFLGFTFSCNVLTGYMMTTTQSDWESVIGDAAVLKPLGSTIFAQVAFTCFYDTIYAYQDYADDKAAGVRSMALQLGILNSKVSIALIAVAQVIFLVMTGFNVNAGSIYFLLTCGGSALLATIALMSCNLRSPYDCGLWFKRCLVYGGIVQCGGLLVEYMQRV